LERACFLPENALSKPSDKRGNMTKSRKSRPPAKTARAKGARKAPPVSHKRPRKPAHKPARARKSGKAAPSDPLDDFVQSAARLLALPIEPQWRAAIKASLAVNLRLAELVAEFALPDEAEPAPIFRA
jgi:hypothetical protein